MRSLPIVLLVLSVALIAVVHSIKIDIAMQQNGMQNLAEKGKNSTSGNGTHHKKWNFTHHNNKTAPGNYTHHHDGTKKLVQLEE